MTYALEVAGTLTITGQAPKNVTARVGVPAGGLLEFAQEHPSSEIVGYESKPVALAA